MAFYRGARRPLDEAEKSTDAAKARARAMELLAGQELSSGGLYERLNRRFAEQTAAAVVAEMVEREYVNDARYAETRAHGLLAAKKSRRAAAQNLRQKGLSASDRTGAGHGLCRRRDRGRPGAGSRRRAGGQPLPQKTGSRTPRPRGGRSDAPGLCICRY